MRRQENVKLKNYTTFRTGGEARYLFEVQSNEEVVEAVAFAKEKGLPIFVLGGGSDILVSDEFFNGLVIKYVGEEVNLVEENDEALVTAEAGVIWDDFVEFCIDKNLQGVECLSGIPGTVGASPIQNIGAYGQEVKDTFERLTAYDIREEKFTEFNGEDCEFSYRESIFKKPENKGRYVITSVTFRLKKDGPPLILYSSLKNYLEANGEKNPSLKEVRDAVLDLRGSKLEDPSVIGNAGSFFKNPIVDRKEVEELRKKYKDIPFYEVDGRKVKLFSGWLIEVAGWKGKGLKNARVSEKNALVITNPEGKATAKEIKELAEKISEDVEKRFGIKLEPEVQFIKWS